MKKLNQADTFTTEKPSASAIDNVSSCTGPVLAPTPIIILPLLDQVSAIGKYYQQESRPIR